jgi:hypothetical protein
VSVAFGNVLSPTVDKLLCRALHFHKTFLPLILSHEPHHFSNVRDAPLCNRRAFYVPACILQVMRFGFERLNLDTPPAFLLLREYRFHLADCDFRV